jgi:hypothetical protein
MMGSPGSTNIIVTGGIWGGITPVTDVHGDGGYDEGYRDEYGKK